MMRGLRQIVRFNWPFYAMAGAAIALIPVAVHRLPLGAAARRGLDTATAAAGFWIVASLVTSWIVYDRSRLMRWTWVPEALRGLPRTWLNIHAGLDESTPALRTLLNGSHGRVFDIFDPAEMTEPSIARARSLARNEIAAEPADFRHLPAPDASIDAALLLLSAHELRTDAARSAFFAELHRVVAARGAVVVAEHLRDWANFVAFGPGFLHFHSRRTWTRCFTRTRFAIERDFSITPFVHAFILRRLA